MPNWSLKPPVMRNPTVAGNEDVMLNDLMLRRPEDFSHNDPAIDRWVLAQHHGLPTRFLDITRNPLVALFFACEENPKDNGEFYIFAVPPTLMRAYDAVEVSIIANFARLEQWMQDSLAWKNSADAYRESLNLITSMIREEKPYFEGTVSFQELLQVIVVEPKHSPERIRIQSGAFLASALHERFEKAEILKKDKWAPVYDDYSFVIPAPAKQIIKKELEMFNITREILFPGLDSSARFVKERYLDAESS